MAARAININADLGEGFGAYTMGDDRALLRIVTSANVACGFHAGDPMVMAATVREAAANGVSIGAHPGFDDLRGFGRRPIPVGAAEAEALVAYQIGALAGIAAAQGARVSHVKPHGALSNMAAVDDDLAGAIARAIRGVDRDLIFLAVAGSAMARAGRAAGLRVAEEAFADRTYDDAGNLTSRKRPDALIRDPAAAVAHVHRMVAEQALFSVDGKRIPTRIDSFCVHGDEPSAVGVARAVREGLERAGFAVRPLTAMEFAA
ncbi:MAG: 5-oxoprolinase subunit PxpA [Alphaproteobacteria bacterium]|nr:5-oxoprolinase subunit PxpA [Alphaproteobacteria bacterium]